MPYPVVLRVPRLARSTKTEAGPAMPLRSPRLPNSTSKTAWLPKILLLGTFTVLVGLVGVLSVELWRQRRQAMTPIAPARVVEAGPQSPVEPRNKSLPEKASRQHADTDCARFPPVRADATEEGNSSDQRTGIPRRQAELEPYIILQEEP
jgi:hypothetical protein